MNKSIIAAALKVPSCKLLCKFHTYVNLNLVAVFYAASILLGCVKQFTLKRFCVKKQQLYRVYVHNNKCWTSPSLFVSPDTYVTITAALLSIGYAKGKKKKGRDDQGFFSKRHDAKPRHH